MLRPLLRPVSQFLSQAACQCLGCHLGEQHDYCSVYRCCVVGARGGVLGMIMAGFLGWLLARSVAEMEDGLGVVHPLSSERHHL